MTSISIVSRLWQRCTELEHAVTAWLPHPLERNPHTLARAPDRLPRFVRDSPVAMRYLNLLAPLDWPNFPERDLHCYRFCPPIPYAPFVAAYLVKLQEQKPYLTKLREYLVEHPPLIWVLGFPLVPCKSTPWGFNPDASLPSARHFTRMLRQMPNAKGQFLLDDTVQLLQSELQSVCKGFGQVTSLDTKHILAWVKENNPKAYVSDRYDKTRTLSGDPDCRLGCKRKRNQGKDPPPDPATPYANPQPASGTPVSEYYWGYASGVVVTKVPDWGEFVLAELTQPFDAPDVSYFLPLMTDTERRLGFRPRYGTFDAAFDAFYVYAHFHREGHPWQYAFAAVPWAKRGPKREFNADGLPLCKAGLPMPLKSTFMNRTSFVPHERGRYGCPLQFPELTADACPIDDTHWGKGGCTTTMATSIGARLRFQIDRKSQLYKTLYNQRSATERINSQAKALGIERPYLRNRQAITNQNTLIYVLINLKALHRIREKKANAPTP